MNSATKSRLTRIHNQIKDLEKKKGKPIEAKDIYEGNTRFQLHYECDVKISELQEKVEQIIGQSE